MLDIAAPGIFAGIGISVWGDFFNRNHYGPLVQKASHKWFPLATFGSDLKIHYAAFFYEFLLCVVLMLLVSVQVWLTAGLEAMVLFQRPSRLPAA